MFRSKSPTIELLLKNETYLNLINKINMDLFKGKVGIFIDYANIVGSQDDLKWHIDVPRLKYFFHCFDQVKKINLYYGTQKNDPKSEKFIHEMMEMDINVTTKFVKKITNSIDVLNIKKDSPTVLKRFIKNSLLQKLDIETIKFLNHKLKRINLSGIKYVYDRKCNFDVELSLDMLLAAFKNEYDTFLLVSGDSDFESAVLKLKYKFKKRVVLLAVGGKIASELSDLKIPIIDIKSLKEFICWKREMSV